MKQFMQRFTQTPSGRSTLRLILILVALPFATGILVYSFLFSYQALGINETARQYGKSTARLIAQQVAPHVVEQDVLSLNVIATRLTENEPVHRVSIYNDADQLLIQSSKDVTHEAPGSQNAFTAEITFQDSVVGFVRVSTARIEQNLAIPLTALTALFVIWMVLAISGSRILLGFILNENKAETKRGEKSEHIEAMASAPDYIEVALLIVRIKPGRTLTRYFNRFFKAGKLYGGIIEQTTPEELVLHFEGPDAIYHSVCAGLLMQTIASNTPARIEYGGVLTNADDSDKSRKSASYLASISEGDLLLSKKDIELDDRVVVSTFHHSLVDSDDLLKVSGLKHQQILDAQATQLMAEPV